MSKQSLAVNSSGALTGTRPLPRTSGPTRMVTSSGPAGRCSAWRVSTTIVVEPGCSLVVERILVREMMKQLYSKHDTAV
jgi:hypothetical protein